MSAALGIRRSRATDHIQCKLWFLDPSRNGAPDWRSAEDHARGGLPEGAQECGQLSAPLVQVAEVGRDPGTLHAERLAQSDVCPSEGHLHVDARGTHEVSG